MLTDLCQELRNWFDVERHYGEFTIAGEALTASFLQPGQYFRIIGSVFNDGVWKYGEDSLVDETFSGAVWAMAIPPSVIALSGEIDQWVQDNKDIIDSPYSSESFGGYSYTKSSSASSDGGDGSLTWQKKFKTRLNKWRKI